LASLQSDPQIRNLSSKKVKKDRKMEKRKVRKKEKTGKLPRRQHKMFCKF